MKKNILLSLCFVLYITIGFSQTNRGRIQAQGSSLEKSKAWAQNSTFTKNEAVTKLDALWDSLTSSQKKDRKSAYTKAKAYIMKAPTSGYCISKTTKRTFQDPQRKDSKARIDIDIFTGCAFSDN